MNYLEQLQLNTNQNTLTENGAITNDSSLDAVLDFFSMGAAMRDRKDDAVKLFQRAFAENPQLAVRCLFYIRDIRGGQGERDIFRACVASLPQAVQDKIVSFVPKYGRYDDLFALSTPLIYTHIKEQLAGDEVQMQRGESISLLAKWLPSENASSKNTKQLAKKVAKELGLKPAQYRKKLSKLRAYINILEAKMSANEWEEVNYETLPAQAHRKHIAAFNKHDEERYTKYIEQVNKGEKKINISTLFTYEVYNMVDEGKYDVANAMWENLPDYTQGNNALVMADVSGSMSGLPMSVSVSLALYFAEHNKGLFNGYFMTFSKHPELVKVLGKTLSEKMYNIKRAHWEMNTNIGAAFMAILQAAIDNKAKQEEMPSVLYIISDMEFDGAVISSKTNYQSAKELFEANGYKLPHVVFWNVNSRQDQAPATKYDKGVTLISGSSQATFRYAVEGKTPIQSMNDILNSERYNQITI